MGSEAKLVDLVVVDLAKAPGFFPFASLAPWPEPPDLVSAGEV